jgi:16S rRNA G966 N2-methylase RsmD
MSTLTLTAPHNPTTGKEYSGGNVPILRDVMDGNPGLSGQFATFRQWLAAGRSVIKGQKAIARLTYYGEQKVEQADGTTKKGGFASSFCVFAFEQTQPVEGDGMPTDRPAEIAKVLEVAPVDAPAYGKQYSLCSLASTGSWKAAEVKEAPAPRPRVNLATLRDKAARLQREADACFAPRDTNTQKRLAQAMNKRLDGGRAQKAAQIILALAAKIEADPACIFATIGTLDLVSQAKAAACMKTIHVNNGYHAYAVETNEPADSSAALGAYRGLLDPRKLEADKKESARILAENALRHSDIPGFFPTPAKVIASMIEAVGGVDGKIVLEPSAGKGDIMQAALNAGADTVTAWEVVPQLARYCREHINAVHPQFSIVHDDDFLSAAAPDGHKLVDVVLMNPPFEKQAAPVHVLHALGFINDSGKLCAVMPQGWQNQKTANALYDELTRRGFAFYDLDLDNGSFAGADSFRQTGVNTCLLVVG